MKNLIVLSILSLSVLSGCACYTVDPGNRGVKVSMGEVSNQPLPEGWGSKAPFVTEVIEVSVRQKTSAIDTIVFSADLQNVGVQMKVLYRIPESAVVRIYRDYSGNAFDTLIAPRVNEALKEVTATVSAEQMAKSRETIKTKALESARAKVGDLVVIEDLVLENIRLSPELENAIEAKMVQEQKAAQAKYAQQQAQIDAETASIRAQGEANAIRIRGQALKETPQLIDLQIVEKWNGVSPLVVGESKGNTILPLAAQR